MEALAAHRLQFAFTITYHYLFPQLTMGLALVIFVLKTRAHFRGDAAALEASRFLIRLFGLGFVMGVVTGIPMEFQFGTNWARFSSRSGGIIGQTLAMEGIFAFFLESSFLYVLLFGEKKFGPKLHYLSSLLLWLGTWTSGFFIVCTNAWMQHPVGYVVDAAGNFQLTSIGALLGNPWAWVEYAHTMVGATLTGAFATAALAAFYCLRGRVTPAVERMFAASIVIGAIASVAAAFPTGDLQAKLVAKHQPTAFAAMEGHFHTEDGAGLTLIGQPNVTAQRIDNPLVIPGALSFLTYQRWDARIEGLNEFPREDWPEHIPLLYYSYHIMAGLGTMFIGLMGLGFIQHLRGRLTRTRPLLWAFFLAAPFPFIANTAGWMTSELGRQPWIIYGLMRTQDGHSEHVSGGNVLFTLLGFFGLYSLLSVLCVLLFTKIIASGPPGRTDAAGTSHDEPHDDSTSPRENA